LLSRSHGREDRLSLFAPPVELFGHPKRAVVVALFQRKRGGRPRSGELGGDTLEVRNQAERCLVAFLGALGEQAHHDFFEHLR
jgi:hypothetical protein